MNTISAVDLRRAKENPGLVKAPANKFRIWKSEWEDPLTLEFDKDVDTIQEVNNHIDSCRNDLINLRVYDDRGVKQIEYLGTRQLPY
jgi:hypothetical protein